MEVLNVGVIGVGGIGETHVRRISEEISGAKVVAINDINEESLARVSQKYGPRIEKDPHALINAPDVQAVIIASWDPTHEEYSIASIKAGKYTLCEKPLANTPKGCLDIMNAEMEHGKKILQVGFMRRYESGYRQMKAALLENEIGRPLLIHAQHRNETPKGAKHTTEMAVEGALVHEFDILPWLIDDEITEAQWASGRSSVHVDEDVIDPQMVYLKTRKGILMDVEFFAHSWYGYEVHCEIVGDEGTLQLPDPPAVIMRHKRKRSVDIIPTWNQRFEATYCVELREWVDAVKRGETVGASAWNGYMACAVAAACTKSRLEGGIQKIDVIEKPEFYK